jgi:hypothetical protein
MITKWREESDKLDLYITEESSTYHAKGRNAYEIDNRLVVLTTNNYIPFIHLNDRRWSVFYSKFPPPEVHQALERVYNEFNNRLHEWEELRHWYDKLLTLKVDERLIRRPFENQAREEAKGATASFTDALQAALEQDGLMQTIQSIRSVHFEVENPKLYNAERKLIASSEFFRFGRAWALENGFDIRTMTEPLFRQAIDGRRFPIMPSKARMGGEQVRVRYIPKW